MRDIGTTIKQARLLGSEKRITLSEITALRNRTITGRGEFDAFNLISDSFDFGFAIGYRMGAKKQKQLSDRADNR